MHRHTHVTFTCNRHDLTHTRTHTYTLIFTLALLHTPTHTHSGVTVVFRWPPPLETTALKMAAVSPLLEFPGQQKERRTSLPRPERLWSKSRPGFDLQIRTGVFADAFIQRHMQYICQKNEKNILPSISRIR